MKLNFSKPMKIVIVVCMWILSTILGLEAMLYVFDPIGARLYVENNFVFDDYVIDGDMFVFKDFSRDGVTTNGGYRVVDTVFSDCSIAFIGDSFTFGWGVRDDETFVNRLAQDSNATISNYGIPSYNSTQILQSSRQHEADGYVWLIVGNDANSLIVPLDKRGKRKPTQIALNLYFITNMGMESRRFPDWERYKDDVANMPENTLIFAFEDRRTTDEAREVREVVSLGSYDNISVISIADTHPDADGHGEIARRMHNHVTSFTEEVCNTGIS